MTSSNVGVLVLPVALFPAFDGSIGFLAFRPAGDWLRASATSDPRGVAEQLLHEQGPSLVDSLPGWRPQLERVTFTDDDRGLTLVYTASLPMTTPLMDRDLRATQPVNVPDGWVDLLAAVRSGARPNREAWTTGDHAGHVVLDYWRQQLEETTAAFDLLPRYFTTSQMRLVYEAVWGKEQDAGNFHKWLHDDNQGIATLADETRIMHEVDAVARAAWMPSLKAAAPGLTMNQVAPKLVGSSPLVAIGGALGAIVGVAVGTAAAGGLVAYQSARNAGPQPKWYRRTKPGRVILKDLYSPRPTWLVQGRMAFDAVRD